MNTIVIDIDDTLINTDQRIRSIMSQILNQAIPLHDAETLGLEQLFLKHATPEQKTQAQLIQKQFWDLVLCLNPEGTDSLNLHKPIPFAAETLQQWSRQCTITYLTGRTENTRNITMRELTEFGFPTHNTQLLMLNIEDYARTRGENPTGPTLIDARSRLMSSLAKKHNVARAVDDYPGYFLIYKQFNVPDRIGLLRPKRYTPQQYIDKGATRVVENWQRLQDDLPKPT